MFFLFTAWVAAIVPRVVGRGAPRRHRECPSLVARVSGPLRPGREALHFRWAGIGTLVVDVYGVLRDIVWDKKSTGQTVGYSWCWVLLGKLLLVVRCSPGVLELSLWIPFQLMFLCLPLLLSCAVVCSKHSSVCSAPLCASLRPPAMAAARCPGCFKKVANLDDALKAHAWSKPACRAFR